MKGKPLGFQKALIMRRMGYSDDKATKPRRSRFKPQNCWTCVRNARQLHRDRRMTRWTSCHQTAMPQNGTLRTPQSRLAAQGRRSRHRHSPQSVGSPRTPPLHPKSMRTCKSFPICPWEPHCVSPFRPATECAKVHNYRVSHPTLVPIGGFNPSEKYSSNGIISPGRVEN